MTETTGADLIAETAGRVLIITRVFDAPRPLVFDAFVDPSQVALWRSPRHSPMVHMQADVRPGGAWRGCLRPLDGSRELWQGGVYREITPHERLAFTFAWDREEGGAGPETLVSITFADQGDKTLMTFRQSVFATPENCEDHRIGWNGAFDRFAEQMARA